MTTTVRSGPGLNLEPGAPSRVPCEWQRPKDLDHLMLLLLPALAGSWTRSRETRTWTGTFVGCSWSCYPTAPASVLLFFKAKQEHPKHPNNEKIHQYENMWQNTYPSIKIILQKAIIRWSQQPRKKQKEQEENDSNKVKAVIENTCSEILTMVSLMWWYQRKSFLFSSLLSVLVIPHKEYAVGF